MLCTDKQGSREEQKCKCGRDQSRCETEEGKKGGEKGRIVNRPWLKAGALKGIFRDCEMQSHSNPRWAKYHICRITNTFLKSVIKSCLRLKIKRLMKRLGDFPCGAGSYWESQWHSGAYLWGRITEVLLTAITWGFSRQINDYSNFPVKHNHFISSTSARTAESHHDNAMRFPQHAHEQSL